MNALIAAIAKNLGARRAGRSVSVVDQVPLFGGSVLHVVDVCGRRLVFATSTGAICLLAQFKTVTSAAIREEESCTSV